MTNLGFVCRGSGRQGNISHGDGLVDDWRRAQAGELAGERFVDGQVAKQGGLISRVGFRLAIALVIAFFDIGFIASILDVVARIRYAIARRVLHVDDCLVKRNFVQRKPV